MSSPTLLSTRNLPLSTTIVLLSGLVAFEGLAVTPALSDMGADLGSVGLLPWVMTSYLLASGLALAASGPLIDGLGSRIVFQFSVVAFALSSLGCGASDSMSQLIALRFVQGASGGTIVACSNASIGIGFEPELRSRAYALASTVWGVMAFAGPALAALLLEVASWRWIFYVNVPLCAVAALLGWRSVPPRPSSAQPLSIDGFGLTLIAGFMTLSLVGISSEGALAAGLLAGSGVFAYLYWRHCGIRRRPVVERRYFVGAPFGYLALLSSLLLMAGIGVETYLPLYLRGGRGASVVLAAWSVIFLTIGWTLSANLVSRLYHRVAEATAALFGTLLSLPTLIACALIVERELPISYLLGAYFVLGLAIGCVTNASLTLLQKQAAETEIGRATAAHQFVRYLGTTYGVALVGAVMMGAALRISGDAHAVQEALGELTPTAELAAGFSSGFFYSHLASLLPSLLAIAVALRVRRFNPPGAPYGT